ncbi:MAG: hypothetical protein JRH07_11905 [Deltaproteobacteria bacterium]|nr:hypothetical protein [Deltaproteobacteria bacterium]MBW2122536.1 hypothetical protein [Deltaproteobacteria bacterium]
MKSADQILREISGLRVELGKLKAGFEALRTELLPAGSLLGGRLRSRGLKIHRENPVETVLIPPDLPPELTAQFYERMKKYSFRLFLRELVRVQGPFRPGDLTDYCSSRVAEQYTRFLKATSTVEPFGGDAYRLNRIGISSFGPTLEWFVAQMFEREFASPAAFGVHFRETDVGGDYDVLAAWEGRLVYVEVKSSPPRSIEDPEVSAFFLRLCDLIPDVAFFFDDTHLRMKDKVIELFLREMEERPVDIPLSHPPERLSDEIYHVDHWLYILNSKRDILGNFTLCLRDHLRQNRGRFLSTL